MTRGFNTPKAHPSPQHIKSQHQGEPLTMPVTKHQIISQASLQCAAWALQCQLLVNDITTRDPNTTGFHRLAASAQAARAWRAYVTVTRTHDPEELARLSGVVSEAVESAATILMVYSTALAQARRGNATAD